MGEGAGVWDHVHVEDVAGCYEVILNRILVGEEVPSGKEGVFFVQAGEHSWREISQRVAEAGVAVGALEMEELVALSLDEAAEMLAGGWRLLGEIGWASKYVFVLE